MSSTESTFPLDGTPIRHLRRVEVVVSLSPDDYRHTHGDTEMMTEPERTTRVNARITLEPHPDWQRPTAFKATIYSRHRENHPDHTEFTANNVERLIPITLAENEVFDSFQDNVRDYVYSQNISGRRHGWCPIDPDRTGFVTSAAVHFDGRGRHDQSRQGFRARLVINYYVAFPLPASEGVAIEGLGVSVGEEMPE